MSYDILSGLFWKTPLYNFSFLATLEVETPLTVQHSQELQK